MRLPSGCGFEKADRPMPLVTLDDEEVLSKSSKRKGSPLIQDSDYGNVIS